MFEFFGAECILTKELSGRGKAVCRGLRSEEQFLTGGILRANHFQSFYIYGAGDCVKGRHVV